ncbi:hypothetical protein LSTR_LSTR015295 [Laodelphax striatellus]|uniref:Cupin-like domain-containing protein n=1 Tax=Laodelphax striatellus TaxID=195883 RepID=A0A482WSM1_LAOST|nr:hypothetical protein LSTR_LSTR015295 [Laodelphax striatellus]
MELNEAVLRLEKLLECADSCGVPRHRVKKRLQSLGRLKLANAVHGRAVLGVLVAILAVGYSLGLHTKTGFTRVWFDWTNRGLNDHACTIRMPDAITRALRPPEDCKFCRDVSAIDVRDHLDPREFEDLYAYTSRPVVVSDGTVNWTAQEVFTFDYFKDLYKDSGERSVCQFFPYNSEFRTLSEVFSMSKERATMLNGTKPWYIGWSNCDGRATDSLRQHYRRPYFLPDNAENKNIDWIFMGSPGYGAKMHVDNVNLPSWQAQLRGKKKWTLEPPPECLYECTKMSIVVEPGEIIVLDTNKWYHQTNIVSEEMSITIGAEYD